MAGNTSDSEEEIQENEENKLVDIVSGFLLNRDIKDVCTLDEMRNNFPLKYRMHDDITVLYKSFVMKRKLIKGVVKRNIEEFYTKGKEKNRKRHRQSIEKKIAVLDVKQKQLQKELARAREELSVLQKNIVRCDEAVQDCHLLKKDVKDYFDWNLFE
ncbi:uncharacterized protein LOC114534557 [Dendronephthya gigantea]|uniref:uncharacterized protein LOC114534557 n=1 Tax=Dendronephthya gigantea TaxID=151771 RepID=UPI00106AFD90|nr:uncharacterized protein LOC114534557 [Dendronephthya gigantea]